MTTAAAFGQEFDAGHAAFLDHLCALGCGVLSAGCDRIRPAHLIGIGAGFIPGIGKFQIGPALGMIGRNEFDPQLQHPDSFDLVRHAQLFEQRARYRAAGIRRYGKRGCLSLSASTTLNPRWANSAAIVDPAGPPPATKTSHSAWLLSRAEAGFPPASGTNLLHLKGKRLFSLSSAPCLLKICPCPSTVNYLTRDQLNEFAARPAPARLHVPDRLWRALPRLGTHGLPVFAAGYEAADRDRVRGLDGDRPGVATMRRGALPWRAQWAPAR